MAPTKNAAMNLSQKKEMKSDAVIGEQILSRIKHIHALMENSKIKIQLGYIRKYEYDINN